MAIRVQKFGGAGLSTTSKIMQVAKHLAALRQQGESVIAVVSAMGNTTNELVAKAYEISEHPDKRELDMLISTGERVSMSLLTMALKDLGCEAMSLTGSQAGIMTDGEHSSAKILEVKPIRVEQGLKEGKVVVIAGFQGVDPKTKEITTLGRGGTDTTAVALSAHFKADRCEIIKDVPGICNADPRVVTEAQLISKVDYTTMKTMCFWGTKALHLQCVELAEKLDVPVWVGPLEGGEGTLVGKEGAGSGMSQLNHVFCLSPNGDASVKKLFSLFANNNWQAPRHLHTSSEGELLLEGDEHLIATLNSILKEHTDLNYSIAWSQHVALTFTGIRNTELLQNQNASYKIEETDFTTLVVRQNKVSEIIKGLFPLLKT